MSSLLQKSKFLVFGLLGIVLLGAWIKIPRKSKHILVEGDAMLFPTVTGTNLGRIDMTFPDDFAGRLNIVFIPFQQWQQRQVDSWVPFVQELEAEDESLRYYEFPTVWEMNAMQRTFLNEGMRAGIPNQTSRERTITLYLDKPAFRERLVIPDESTTHLFLVAKNGQIVWRTDGEFSAEKSVLLKQAITNYAE